MTYHIGARIKDPNAVDKFTIDWDDGFLAGATLLSSTVIVPAGITLDSDTNDNTTVTVTLSGGTVGDEYTVTNRISTSDGRTDDRSVRVRILER